MALFAVTFFLLPRHCVAREVRSPDSRERSGSWGESAHNDDLTSPPESVRNLPVAEDVGDEGTAILESPKRSTGPKYAVVQNTELIYEKPEDASKLLLVLHECRHGATDFWEKSPACEKCTGLTEQRKIVRTALDAGYAVVAISASDSHSRCWQVRVSREERLLHKETS
jgi:hypothetical protein